MENWKWGTDSSERKSCNRLPRNWRIEKSLLRRNRSSKTSKNWWIVCASVKYWLKFWIYRTKKIPCQKRENFTILKQRAALERPTFPVNTLQFRVPGPCLAAILDCRTIHGILWVLQETFLNDCLLEKDEPPLSSRIQRIWHPLLKNWDLKVQEIQRGWRVKWDENRKIRQYLYHTPQSCVIDRRIS